MDEIAHFTAVDAATWRTFEADAAQVLPFVERARVVQPAFQTDVDQAWHGLHFMLSGQADGGEGPLAWAVRGGTPTGPDLGHGPARALSPQQVRDVAAALDALGDADFCERFDPPAMEAAGIQPVGVWGRLGQHALDDLLDALHGLTAFYRDAVQRGDAMLVWLD